MSAYIRPNSQLNRRNVNNDELISMSGDVFGSPAWVTNLVDELLSSEDGSTYFKAFPACASRGEFALASV
jgi:hypothetical protein